MKDKAKQIFALSGVFICILVLLSNIIFTVASASNTITYEMYVEMARNMVINSFNEKCANSEEYTEYICIYDVFDDMGVVGTFVFMTPDVNITNVQTFNDNYWGEQIKITTDGLKSVYVNFNVKQYIENDIKLDVNIIDSTSIQESISREHQIMTANVYNKVKNFDYGLGLDNDNVVGGLPLKMSEITFEHYYNKLSDLSHDITITNNSSKDIYYTLRCIMPQNMVAINSYEHLMYMYKEKQEYNGITSIKYNQLVTSSAETAAEWISQYFASQAVLSEYNLTQNEIYNNLMSDTAFWHRSNIYTSGTVGLPYMTAYNISQSEMGAESEHNAIIATLNNNVVNVSYTVDGFSSGNVYENSSIIKLSAGETKNINIPQNYMSLNNGVYYQWVLSVGETIEDLTEHSRKGFTATSSNIGVIPPENIGSDKYVYDEQGNIIGEFDGNGNIVIFDNNNNNTPSLDVPQFDTTSFGGLLDGIGAVIKMFYKILPVEVYSIITFGLSVILAVGIIRLVTG